MRKPGNNSQEIFWEVDISLQYISYREQHIYIIRTIEDLSCWYLHRDTLFPCVSPLNLLLVPWKQSREVRCLLSVLSILNWNCVSSCQWHWLVRPLKSFFLPSSSLSHLCWILSYCRTGVVLEQVEEQGIYIDFHSPPAFPPHYFFTWINTLIEFTKAPMSTCTAIREGPA